MTAPAEITIPVDEETARRLGADAELSHSYMIQIGTMPAAGRWFVVAWSGSLDGGTFVTLRQMDDDGPEIVRSAPHIHRASCHGAIGELLCDEEIVR